MEPPHRPRPSRLRRHRARKPSSVSAVALCGLLALISWSGSARAEAGVIVEVSESGVSAAVVRRLVRLELAELSIPAPMDPAAADAPLYFRVHSASDSSVEIELWQTGTHYGSRKVSAEGGGHLTARRIALAAAELARRLRQVRLSERRAAEREAAAAAEARAKDPGYSLEARTTLAVQARGALIGPSDLWLVGPELRGGLRFSSGARIEIGAAGLAGGVLAADGEGAVRWLELSASPGYVFGLGRGLGLDVGFDGAAAAVHLTKVTALDEQEGQTDTWSARAGAHVRLELPLGGGWLAAIGPEAGAVLRPVLGTAASGERLRLGGLWAGVSVGVVLDPPSAPD